MFLFCVFRELRFKVRLIDLILFIVGFELRFAWTGNKGGKPTALELPDE